jgi:Concanavalin A-like lectin/glucanases superfamily
MKWLLFLILTPAMFAQTIPLPLVSSKAPASGGGGGGSPIITSGLILYYKFDDGSGTNAVDVGGSSFTGGLSGTSIPTWVTGYIGANALSFDGSHGYVDSFQNSPFNFASGDFSLSAWVKTSSSGTEIVIGKFLSSGDKYWLGASGGTAFFSVNGNNVNSSITINDGNWHHLAGAASNAVTRIYVDGSLTAAGSYTKPCNPGGNLHIGDFGSDGSFRWSGTIDEPSIYSRALTLTEIGTLFNQTHP